MMKKPYFGKNKDARHSEHQMVRMLGQAKTQKCVNCVHFEMAKITFMYLYPMRFQSVTSSSLLPSAS